MPAKPRKREKYTREYKIEAVRLSSEGVKLIAAVVSDLGIPAELLYRWRRAFAESGVTAFPGNGNIHLTKKQ